MEPRIQYAKTSDGVSIAYCSLGRGYGPALVYVFGLTVPTHFQMEWQIPAARTWYERLCLNRRLILFDLRGTGSSQRDVTDYSLDAMVRDVEAVTGRLSLDRFALYGQYLGAATAIVYATRHPERVSHLITWDGVAKYPNLAELRAPSSFVFLMRDDWELFTEVYSHQAFGWPEGEVARSYAALTRQAIARDALARQFLAAGQFDATALLPQVKAPALVMRRAGASDAADTATRTLAAGIPDSRVLVFEGARVAYPFLGDSEPVADAIDAFLSEGGEPSPIRSGTAVMLFADVVDSTALTERLGDAAFREKARELDSALRGVIRENGGTCIEAKTLGDGVLAVFTSARQAIGAALACGTAGNDAGLPLHLGLHAGDVLREKDAGERENVYGGAVNIAARISGLSAPGEVLVSETVRSLARTSAGVRFEDRGEQALKGVGEPVRVWAVREGEV